MSILFVVYVSNKRFSFKRLPFFLLFQSPTTIYLTDYRPLLRFPFYLTPSRSNDQPVLLPPPSSKMPDNWGSELARSDEQDFRSQFRRMKGKEIGRPEAIPLCATCLLPEHVFTRKDVENVEGRPWSVYSYGHDRINQSDPVAGVCTPWRHRASNAIHDPSLTQISSSVIPTKYHSSFNDRVILAR